MDNLLELMADKEKGKRLIYMSTRVGKSFYNEFFKATLWRLSKEVPGSVKIDLPPILEDIKKQTEDTERRPIITLVHAYRDRLFTPEIYEQGLDFERGSREDNSERSFEDGPAKYVDRWMMYVRKRAGHIGASVELPGLIVQILESNDEMVKFNSTETKSTHT